MGMQKIVIKLENARCQKEFLLVMDTKKNAKILINSINKSRRRK